MAGSGGKVVREGPTWLGLLALLFIGLKLGGAIDWSWWWVLAPLWLPALIAGVIIGGLIWIYKASKKGED